jgi:RNA polymerase primary sigma factor
VKEANAILDRYLRDLRGIPLLSAEAESELGRRIQSGDTVAREQMIKSNLRLVVTIARDYADLGIALCDLIAEGNIGLMQAVDRFDPRRGARFSSYGTWWIKQAIKRALANQGKTVRLPSKIISKVSRMLRISAQLSNDLGHEASADELADELGIPVEEIARLRSIGLNPISLDEPIDSEEGTSLGDQIADETSRSSDDLLLEKDFAENLKRVVKTLSEREAAIIEHRFGLTGAAAKSLRQVSELIGLTHERVRQVELTALQRLRRALQRQFQSSPPTTLAAA